MARSVTLSAAANDDDAGLAECSEGPAVSRNAQHGWPAGVEAPRQDRRLGRPGSAVRSRTVDPATLPGVAQGGLRGPGYRFGALSQVGRNLHGI